MKTHWLVLIVVGVLLLVGFSGWQAYRADKFRTERDTALAISAQHRAIDSVTAQEGEAAARWADSVQAAAILQGRRADSVTAILRRPRPPLPLPDSTASDSVRYWRGVAETLQVDLWTASQSLEARTAEASGLRVALDSQKVATARFRAAYEGEQRRADLLEKTLRRAPTGCPKVPLLGIPVPRVGAGYAVTTNGSGPAVAVIVPLGGC